MDWRNVEIFAIPSVSLPVHYVMVPSWWRDLEAHRLFLAATPPVVPNYSLDILYDHAWLQLVWGIDMSEFSVCTFTAFLCMAPDGSVSAENGSSLPCIWNSDMLISLSSGVCEKF